MNTPETTLAMPSAAQQGDANATVNRGVPIFVSAEKDLVAKPGADQDSWFVISNLTSSRGTLNLLVHYLAIQPPGAPKMVLAMYSLLDPKTGKYLTEEKAYPATLCTLSDKTLDVRTPSGTVTGSAARMHVTADFTGLSVDIELAHTGPLLANLGNGVMPALGDINYEFALPSMTTRGTVTVDGERYDVSGETWFDRQWGMTPRFFGPGTRKWIWFGVSLDNGDRLSVWELTEDHRQHAFATLLHPDGAHEVVAVEPLEQSAGNRWTSPATGRIYPTKWDVRIPQLKARLQIEPAVREQEIVSEAGAHKYEGASSVVGELHGKPVTGRAVIELVGDWV